MKDPSDETKYKKYQGDFKSFIDVIYQIRCNLFHGRKDISEDKRDIYLVGLALNLLLPFFKKILEKQNGRL